MAAIIVGPTNWQSTAVEEQQVQTASLGDQILTGGYLICRSGGGTAWIVAPLSTEVSRTWYYIDDAVITANANAPFGDWFVPTCGQLKNPGYTCRTYWDTQFTPASDTYWSSTQYDSNNAWGVDFDFGPARDCLKSDAWCVRAFRCISY